MSGFNLVFIHRSIKTRIETQSAHNRWSELFPFLYIDPLKQGLKPYEENKRD